MSKVLCEVCGQPVWFNPAFYNYRHNAARLDGDHRASVATGTYLDSRGMRAAHLRSARGEVHGVPTND